MASLPVTMGSCQVGVDSDVQTGQTTGMEFAYNKLQHVSASQISTFARCPRKHWLEKVGGIPSPTSAGAEFGTRGHAAIEHRIQNGEWPEDQAVVQVAVAGWRFIPPPPLLVEAEMSLEGAALPIVGRIDLIAPDSSVVIDHKFLSSFRYAKTPAELAEDPQAILYTTWAQQRGYLRREHLAFRHVVYQTRGQPQAQSAQVVFVPSDLQQRFDVVRTTIERIAEAAQLRDPVKVAAAMDSADPSPCKAYGGCPHQNICQTLAGRSVWQGIEAKKETEMSQSLMDRLAKKKQTHGVQSAGDVNPPEAPAAPVAVVATGEGTTGAKAVQSSLFDFPPSEAEMAEYHAEEAKKPKAVQDTRLTDPFQLKTLYVGCMPMNEAVVLLDNWLSPLLASAAQSLGVPHHGMAGYGKGKPALAALVQHKATTEGVPLVLVADPRMPSTEVALEVLRPLYDRIVVRFG